MTTTAATWFRVSGDGQHSDNQIPDVAQFTSHHGYQVTASYTISDTAWRGGGGPEYKAILAKALDDAHAGKFSVLVIWSLDRIVRTGAEEALKIIRQFRERGCTVVSVRESWLNGSPEVADVLVSFAGWMAERESARRSERIRAGLQRRKAEGGHVGRKPGSRDKAPRKRSGYVAMYEPGGTRHKAA
jgi:DNA invertase Pin-like site-specific DNA recombinase